MLHSRAALIRRLIEINGSKQWNWHMNPNGIYGNERMSKLPKCFKLLQIRWHLSFLGVGRLDSESDNYRIVHKNAGFRFLHILWMEFCSSLFESEFFRYFNFIIGIIIQTDFLPWIQLKYNIDKNLVSDFPTCNFFIFSNKRVIQLTVFCI